MNLKPLGNCLLIEQEIEKQGLIILSQTNKLAQGTIRAVGPGNISTHGVRIEMALKVGDHVLFGEHSGQKVQFENKDYLMMREPDVIGITNA